jgi:hypothetical protein
MRVLLDECVSRLVIRHLPGHDIWKVQDKGWAGKKNGELLKLMLGDGFDVLLTVDKSLKHQQNIKAAGLAVVLMRPRNSTIVELLPLMPAVLTALGSIKPGDFVEILPVTPKIP